MTTRKMNSKVTPMKKAHHRMDPVRAKVSSGFPWKTVIGTSAALGMAGIAWNILRKRENAVQTLTAQTDFAAEGGQYREDFSERL